MSESDPDSSENVARAAALYDELASETRLAVIDLESCNSNPARGALESSIGGWFAGTALSTNPDKLRHLWKALTAQAVRDHAWEPPARPARRVSTSPPAEEHIRRAVRVLAMVGELHKTGYQRLRIHPWLHGSGAWRCAITSADNVGTDGYSAIRHDDDSVAVHSSADYPIYFQRIEGAGLNARQLAQKFLETFPDLAGRGRGQDWLYAGWFVDVLGQAESGSPDDIPMWAGDQWGEPDARWLPIPPPLTPAK